MVDKIKEKKIIAGIFLFPILSIIIAAIAITIVLYFSNEKLSRYILKDTSDILYDTHKVFIKNIVLSISNSIKCRINDSENRVKKRLVSKIDEAHNIIKSIIKAYPNASKGDIKKMVIASLRAIRYNNGRGYIFAYDNSSKIVIYHPMKKFIGSNISKRVDKNGKSIAQNNEEVLKKGGGAGFIIKYFYKPGGDGKKYKKIDYIRYIKELDWVIGTGEYLDDMKRDVKKSIIKYLLKKRYGNNIYLWIIDKKGVLIMHPFLTDKIGKNISNLEDKKGEKVVQLFIKKRLSIKMELFWIIIGIGPVQKNR